MSSITVLQYENRLAISLTYIIRPSSVMSIPIILDVDVIWSHICSASCQKHFWGLHVFVVTIKNESQLAFSENLLYNRVHNSVGFFWTLIPTPLILLRIDLRVLIMLRRKSSRSPSHWDCAGGLEETTMAWSDTKLFLIDSPEMLASSDCTRESRLVLPSQFDLSLALSGTASFTSWL